MGEKLKEKFRQLIKGNYEFDDQESEEKMFETLYAAYQLAEGEKWISVNEYLPEKSGWYLVYGSYTRDCPQKTMEAIFHKKNNPKYSYFTSNDGIKTKNVTHWQSLPPPPVK